MKKLKVCWLSAGVSSFMAGYLAKDVDEWIYIDIADQHLDSMRFIINLLKLTFKARACGIHVILCTQRPDSKSVNGKLKNNFQCRVAFSMACHQDSQTILGRKGAEVLTGKGDGIFRNNNGTSNIRFQSPLVTEKEIKGVVEQCKKMYIC